MNHKLIRTIDTSASEEDRGTAGATITTTGFRRADLVGLTHWELIDGNGNADVETRLFTPDEARDIARALVDAAAIVDATTTKTSTGKTSDPTPEFIETWLFGREADAA